MKFTCTKASLQQAVQTVQKAVATKTPLSILTGIYLAASDSQLELQATDYEIGISCSIAADVSEPGKAVLSGRYFQELVRRLPGETVEIATNSEDTTIRIACAASQFNLLNLPYEEFPTIQKMALDHTLTLKDNILRELIKKTVFACAADESRPIFTGALLEAENTQIKMVGTNTHRLALKQERVEEVPQPAKMIIPAKILNELGRVLTSDIPQDVAVFWQKNQVAFSFDNVYISSRLIEGQFPDYNRVIPAGFQTRVQIQSQEFLDAVERVSLMARDSDYNVIKFRFADDQVQITSNNPDIGKACETVPAVIEGDPVDIAFNAKYVTDILKNIDSESLIFSFNNSLSPASIKPIDDENYTYIITPVRTA